MLLHRLQLSAQRSQRLRGLSACCSTTGQLWVASSPAVLGYRHLLMLTLCCLLQMATFMQDLESSGLLAEDDEYSAAASATDAAAAPAADAAGPAAAAMANGAHAPSNTSRSSIQPFAEPQQAASGDVHTEAQTETTAQLSGGQAGVTPDSCGEASAHGAVGDSMAAEDDAGEGGDGGQAEQRVLGALQGIDGWSEVMDMASRQVCPPPSGPPRLPLALPEGRCGWSCLGKR